MLSPPNLLFSSLDLNEILSRRKTYIRAHALNSISVCAELSNWSWIQCGKKGNILESMIGAVSNSTYDARIFYMKTENKTSRNKGYSIFFSYVITHNCIRLNIIPFTALSWRIRIVCTTASILKEIFFSFRFRSTIYSPSSNLATSETLTPLHMILSSLSLSLFWEVFLLHCACILHPCNSSLL